MKSSPKREPTTRMTSSGQVTIPKRYREILKLNPGQLLNVEIREGCIVFMPMELVRSGKHRTPGEDDGS